MTDLPADFHPTDMQMFPRGSSQGCQIRFLLHCKIAKRYFYCIAILPDYRCFYCDARSFYDKLLGCQMIFILSFKDSISLPQA